MSNQKNHEIHFKTRPQGMPTAANFEVVETAVPTPGPGQVLVRNSYMSVDPYMRGRMSDRASYAEGFKLGEAMTGGAVGQVVASNNDKFKVGEHVSHFGGWREWYVSTGADFQKVDPKLAPLSAYLGTFGMPGLTAYAGLLRVGELKDGETVFVSAASGAVGAVACQIAKAKGCTVIGTAGSDEKCQWLKDVAKVDHAINYKTAGDLSAALRKAAPKGIDVYFDNVGEDHLNAALANMKLNGRIPVCGMIAQYNATTPPPGPSSIIAVIPLRLTIKGFIVSDHGDMAPQFIADMAKWTMAGKMKWQETIKDGIENAPQAFLGLFSGDNTGKMVVRVGPDSAV
ncbi:MAG TPA: NADP-dependent oxidoreductase [Rhizomicrobium sp.]